MHKHISKKRESSFYGSTLQFQRLLCLVTHSCLTLCDPMDCSPSGSSVHGDSPGKNTGVGCCALLQEAFPIQGSNPCLLHLPVLLGMFFNTSATWEAPYNKSRGNITLNGNKVKVFLLNSEQAKDAHSY